MHRAERLLGYLKPYRAVFLASLGAALVASVLDGFTFALLIPFLRLLFDMGPMIGDAPSVVERVVGAVVGGIADGDGVGALRGLVFVILAAIMLKNVAAYAATYLSVSIQERVTRDLRRQLFAHIQQFGLGYFQQTKGGQLVSRMFSDVDQVKVFLIRGWQSVIHDGALVVVYLTILFSLSWRLGLITLLLAPAIAGWLKPMLVRVRLRFAGALSDRGELTAIMAETIGGARVVKTHGAEAYERRRFTAALDGYCRKTLGAERWATLASPLSETVGAGVFVLLLLVGTWSVLRGNSLRPELFMAFTVVTLRLLRPVKLLAQFPAFAQQALAGADRVFEVLDREPDDVDERELRALPGLVSEIRFENVWFAYRPGHWVLKGVGLTVRRGEVVAIVGPSGAGKSTLVDLLPRFIDPLRGEVLIDGVPTTRYARRSLRRVIGVVSQETMLFNDTVLANIAYGEEGRASRAAVEAAASAANAHEFIRRLPRGYETLVGERGTQLSGGQRQRIAIARALLRDPPILVLDEATSALDSESERLVREAVARLLENRTVFVIAHRVSTVATADRIVVLDDGAIAEEGRHDELMIGGGIYQRLHDGNLIASHD